MFNIGKRHFEIDELLDQRDWNGPGTKLFDLFEVTGGLQYNVEAGIPTIKECMEIAKGLISNG